MKAIAVYTRDGKPELVWEDAGDPVYGPGDVLIDVKATAVNRADLSQAQGNYPPPPGVTEVLGLEAAGVVVAVGEDVQGIAPGARVCTLLPGGGYAEKVAAPAEMLLELPDNWTFAQGAAIPEVWLTAFLNLFHEGKLEENQTVLIHAGGSGVGTAAIQLARLAGATVFVTAGTEGKLATARELGASLAVNYKEVDFATEVEQATRGQGIDLILDPVGADYFERNLRLLRPNGRLVQIGLLSGSQATINLGQILGKSLRIIGSRLRPRPVPEKIRITAAFRDRFWPHLLAGELRPVIDRTFPLPEAGDAHAYVRQNRNTGKVILVVE